MLEIVREVAREGWATREDRDDALGVVAWRVDEHVILVGETRDLGTEILLVDLPGTLDPSAGTVIAGIFTIGDAGYAVWIGSHFDEREPKPGPLLEALAKIGIDHEMRVFGTDVCDPDDDEKVKRWVQAFWLEANRLDDPANAD